MLREITVPHSEFLTIRIPKDYLEQEVEILVFPIRKNAVNNSTLLNSRYRISN